jgi:hypothetical protein
VRTCSRASDLCPGFSAPKPKTVRRGPARCRSGSGHPAFGGDAREGPLTLSSLRRAAAAGTLEIAKVAGKDLTTPRAIRKLVKPSCRAAKPSRHDSGSEKTMDAGSFSIGQAESDGRSAQAVAAITLTALRKRSKSTSARYTRPLSEQPILVPSPLPTCSLSRRD